MREKKEAPALAGAFFFYAARVRRLALLPLFLLAFAQAQDLLGQTFSPQAFSLCRAYGCRTLSADSEVARLQLLRQDARLTLYLSGGVVMGLDVWVMSPKLSGQQQQFLLNVAERAAEQKLSLTKLTACWQKVRPGQSRLVLGGGDEHYGVACLRQPDGKTPGRGLRIYFDL